MSALAEIYPYLKTLHILSIILWMLGMLYLPRIYAYHAEVLAGSETDTIFQTMETHLLKNLLTPIMIVAFITGILLIFALSGQVGGWFPPQIHPRHPPRRPPRHALQTPQKLRRRRKHQSTQLLPHPQPHLHWFHDCHRLSRRCETFLKNFNATPRWGGPLCNWCGGFWCGQGGVWNTRRGVGIARAGEGGFALVKTLNYIKAPRSGGFLWILSLAVERKYLAEGKKRQNQI